MNWFKKFFNLSDPYEERDRIQGSFGAWSPKHEEEAKYMDNKMPQESIYHQGWQCPICKTIYSPLYKTCDICSKKASLNRPTYNGPSCGNVTINDSPDPISPIMFTTILHDDNNYMDTPSEKIIGGGGDFGGGGSTVSFDNSSSSDYSSDCGSCDCSCDCGSSD